VDLLLTVIDEWEQLLKADARCRAPSGSSAGRDDTSRRNEADLSIRHRGVVATQRCGVVGLGN
jgi:hypothetical protein